MVKRRGSGPQATHTDTATIKPEPAPGKHESPASVQSVEPEDPRHTGSSKSMQRTLLRHNNEHGHTHHHPESVAAQHATGSFTTEGPNPEEAKRRNRKA